MWIAYLHDELGALRAIFLAKEDTGSQAGRKLNETDPAALARIEDEHARDEIRPQRLGCSEGIRQAPNFKTRFGQKRKFAKFRSGVFFTAADRASAVSKESSRWSALGWRQLRAHSGS